MKRKFRLIGMIAGFGALAGLVATGCGAVRGGYESAPYRVARTIGKLEVRDYHVLTVAETSMARGSNESNGSFNRLFRFISGSHETITTPERSGPGGTLRPRLGIESADGHEGLVRSD